MATEEILRRWGADGTHPIDARSDQDSGTYIVRNPFDQVSKADCILKTCDGAEFKVVRAILCLASTVFNDMFNLPQNPNEAVDRSDPTKPPQVLPVIDLAEDAKTLDIILRCIYPIAKPSVKSFESALAVTKACEKYMITPSILSPISAFLSTTVESPPSLDARGFWSNPTVQLARAYALSWRLSYRGTCIKASRRLLEDRTVDLFDVLPVIQEAAGDRESSRLLKEAHKSRSNGIRDIMSAGLQRIGFTMCEQCLVTWTTVRETNEQLEDALNKELRNETSPLFTERMYGVLEKAEIKVMERNRCRVCISAGKKVPARVQFPSRTGAAYHVEILWPSHVKEDCTP